MTRRQPQIRQDNNSLGAGTVAKCAGTKWTVPDIADLCRIDLLGADGALERKITHHRDPERTRAIAGWVGQSAASPAAPGDNTRVHQQPSEAERCLRPSCSRCCLRGRWGDGGCALGDEPVLQLPGRTDLR